MYNFRNYIFDLDGTIINSSEEVLLCMQKAFEEAKVNVEKSKFIKELIGPPIKIIIQNIAPELNDEEKILEITANFRRIYDNDNNDISKLYDGILDLLSLLKSQGKKLFIATFKPKKPTMRIVEQFKLNYFDDVYTIDKFEKSMTKGEMLTQIVQKYNLNKNETVMIGDAKSDMTAAKEAGITGIGVLWGYDENKADLKNNADVVVSSVNDLKTELLQEIQKNYL